MVGVCVPSRPLPWAVRWLPVQTLTMPSRTITRWTVRTVGGMPATADNPVEPLSILEPQCSTVSPQVRVAFPISHLHPSLQPLVNHTSASRCRLSFRFERGQIRSPQRSAPACASKLSEGVQVPLHHFAACYKGPLLQPKNVHCAPSLHLASCRSSRSALQPASPRLPQEAHATTCTPSSAPDLGSPWERSVLWRLALPVQRVQSGQSDAQCQLAYEVEAESRTQGSALVDISPSLSRLLAFKHRGGGENSAEEANFACCAQQAGTQKSSVESPVLRASGTVFMTAKEGTDLEIETLCKTLSDLEASVVANSSLGVGVETMNSALATIHRGVEAMKRIRQLIRR